jgi:dienelactone hydrolase
MLRMIAAVVLGMAIAPLQAAVVGKEVSYQAGDTVMKGYLAYDDNVNGKRPGVLVVHEWWGHNAYARKRADMLAELGYTALAVDMYGDGKTADHPDNAGKFATAVRQDQDMMLARFNAARHYLNSNETVDPELNAAIGYCFGGSVVLSVARSGADLEGVVSFHGSLDGLPPISDKVTAKVLVANGADDPFVGTDSIDKFKQDMEIAGVDFEFINYPGAKHGFTNPEANVYGEKFGLPLEYNAEADRASWHEMQKFLDSIFE